MWHSNNEVVGGLLGIFKSRSFDDVNIPKDACKDMPMQMEGIDPKTGHLIPFKKIEQDVKAIDELQRRSAAGRKAWKTCFQETGDLKQARKASKEASGGGLTQIFDELHREKVLVSLVVVCPPATEQEAKENEVRLKYIIYQLSEFMLG